MAPCLIFPIFDRHWNLECVCLRQRERGVRGQKQPLLCLQEQGLAAEERKEKRGEDCVWNCPSVAVVVLSHFISATAAFFPSIYLPSDYSSPLSEQEKHSLSHHGWLNTITNSFFSHHLSCSHYLFTQHRSLSKCYSFFSLPLRDPITFIEVQSTEKLPHFTSSAHAISICSLNIRVGCKCHAVSGNLQGLLERFLSLYTQRLGKFIWKAAKACGEQRLSETETLDPWLSFYKRH